MDTSAAARPSSPVATPTVAGNTRTLAEIIRDIRVAMITTTIGPEPAPGIGSAVQAAPPMTPGHTGRIDLRQGTHTRPMYNQTVDPGTFAGELFYMTSAHSRVAREVAADPRVLITYAAPDRNRYAVLHGSAECLRDPAKARELWNIHAKGWWPNGPDDPELMILRVSVESAEYWDGPSNTSYLLSLLKAVATGERVQVRGEHGVVA